MCVCVWLGGWVWQEPRLYSGRVSWPHGYARQQPGRGILENVFKTINLPIWYYYRTRSDSIPYIWTLRNSKEPTFTQKLITNKTSSCSFWQQETKKSDKPKPPPPSIVLPVEVMKQMIQKALDHTQRLNKGTFVWQSLAYCIMFIAKGPGQLSIRRRN